MSRTMQRRRLMTAAVATLLAAGSAGVAAPARAATPGTPALTKQTPARAPAKSPVDPITAAMMKAKSAGEPVPITSLTDEYTTTSANPDGTLTRNYATAPQRVRQGGKWVPIDTTLVKRSDGSFGPRAAISDLTVAAGGGTDLLTMRDGSRSLKFSWPEKLPAPTVAGDTATYPEVFPGVDLQIIADATGYSSMLVVKTAEAAANPAVAKVGFGVSAAGVKLAGTRDGGAEATDTRTGEQVFSTGTAVMWDSTPSAGSKEPADVGTVGEHRSKIAVDVKGGRQSLTLDQKLLKDKATRYPVYVDPYWSGNPSQIKWARISSNGWNVYNSTSKTGSTSARIGYDNWAGGGAERARTYYQMNTSGIRGAEIFEASLYVTERWAASCYNTAAVVYGTAAPSGWSSSKLYWGHEPAKSTGVLSTVNGQELSCGTSKVRVSPASLKFNVLSYLKTVAKSKLSSATFLVQAKDMDDKYAWKQLGYGGGATLSVKYSYKPGLLNGTGTPKTSPSVVDQGRNVTTTHTPTISAKGVNPKVNGLQENVRIEYQILKAGVVYKTGYSGYSLNGGAWTVPSLPDGTYTWRATVQNASGLWAGVWTATQTMVVDTVAPKAPTVKSTQFPPNQLGAAFTDRGVFALGNDRTNNVNGYLFSLDANLANVVYSTTKGTTWSAAAQTAFRAGTIYFAKSDNATGMGTAVVNGAAGVAFAPLTAGAHVLYVKAVDQAGSTSPQTSYVFNAGARTPTYAYGSKLVSGWTATNTDGTTTVVPPAVKTSAGGIIISQAPPAGMYFGDGFQAVLGNSPTTKVAKGDKVTFSFNIPATGAWEIGTNLTTGILDGIYELTLDSGQATAKTLLSGYDAYTSPAVTRFVNFGVIKDAAGKPMTLNKGVHTLTITMTGTNAASGGYQAGIDVIRLSPVPTCTINDPSLCYNNTAISTYTAGTPATLTPANADGSGFSFESTDLKATGWTPGNTVTVNGASIKLPAAYGTGAPDNMLASGQIVKVPATGVVNKGNAVVFVGFTTGGGTNGVQGATGTVNYVTSTCGMKSQAFTIGSVADWGLTKPSEAVLTLPKLNRTDGTQTAAPHSFFAVSVPLLCPGAAVESIVLPLQTNTAQANLPALHFVGLGIRPSSSNGSTHWVGSWSSAQDTAALQTETHVNATMTNQTVRIPAQLSLGTGGDTQQVRVHLANSLGKTPVTFDAASIAVRDAAGGATAAATPIALTFGGSATATLPAGTDLVSDPVTLTVAERAGALVSIKVHGSVTTLSGHRDPKTPIYVSAADNVDHTKEAAATNFPEATWIGSPFLAGIDVTTSATSPQGALVLFGDQTINSDTSGSDDKTEFSSKLAEVLANAEDGDGTLPFGVLNQGSSSRGNQSVLPDGGTVPDPVPNSAALVDRAILAQTNVRAALISEGSADLLTCTGTADACATTVKTKLISLASQLRNYKCDDASDPSVVLPTPSGAIKVYVATLPAFTGTHTAIQEAARKLVNDEILAGNLQGYADGVINFAAAVSADGTEAGDAVLSDYLLDDGASHLYPSALYYETLAYEYLAGSDKSDRVTEDETGTDPSAASVAVWNFDEGTGTVADDSGAGTGNPPVTHNATLSNVAWGGGRLVDSKAGTFNGTSSSATTDLKVNTAKSFSVSAWVRLTDKSADRTVFTRDSTGFASLYLQYNKAEDRWLAQMPSATAGDAVVWYNALSDTVPQTGLWTHLGAVYDADLHSLTLYVNGAAETSIEEVTPFNDVNGAAWIGRGATTWFAGDIAGVRVWARATDPAEMDEWASAEPVVDWELEDNSLATVAQDSTFHEHDGTLTGGASWIAPGHSDWDFSAVNFNGTNAAITSGPLLRTDQSFSVAAWVRLTKADANYTVISQEGAHNGRFMLQYSKLCSCWRFLNAKTDVGEADTVVVDAPGGVTLNSWTHLAAVYDATTGTLTIYVNGVPTSTTTTLVPWQANGSFVVGRTRWTDANSDWFPGDIDAVHAYQGVIPADLVQELSTS